MKLGNWELPPYAMLAPMAGVSDRALRELCRRDGAANRVVPAAHDACAARAVAIPRQHGGQVSIVHAGLFLCGRGLRRIG